LLSLANLASLVRIGLVGFYKIARFFLVQQTETGKNIPKWPQKYPNNHKIYQNGTKMANRNYNTKWP
jgi:hypothetical protein